MTYWLRKRQAWGFALSVCLSREPDVFDPSARMPYLTGHFMLGPWCLIWRTTA